MKLIGASTKLVALLGCPVGHSFSPAIHNAALRASGIDARYLAFDVPAPRLPDAVSGLAALGAAGANVTIPHKRSVAALVDELSDVAAEIGAVNTLVFWSRADGAPVVRGDNTDVAGFLEPLLPHRKAVSTGTALVLGTGGSARAVVLALARVIKPAGIVVAGRSREGLARLRAEFLELGVEVEIVPFESAARAADRSVLVVNATPVGMEPDAECSPLPAGSVGAGQIAYDLIYNPANTRLLANAGVAGATTIDGTEMLIGQAAASFKLWFGIEMPVSEARAALEEAIVPNHG